MKKLFEVKYLDDTIPHYKCKDGTRYPAYLKSIVGYAERLEIAELVKTSDKFKKLNIKCILIH